MKKALLLLPFLLLACKGEEAPQENQMVGMANPASVYCASIGGTSNPETTPQGAISICVLPSGERIEEWALYHRDHPTPTDEASEGVTPESQIPIGEQVDIDPPAQSQAPAADVTE